MMAANVHVIALQWSSSMSWVFRQWRLPPCGYCAALGVGGGGASSGYPPPLTAIMPASEFTACSITLPGDEI